MTDDKYQVVLFVASSAGAVIPATTQNNRKETMQRLSFAIVQPQRSLCWRYIGVGRAFDAKTTSFARYQPREVWLSRWWGHNSEGFLNSTTIPPYFATASSRISRARAERVAPFKAAATVLRFTHNSSAIDAIPPRSTTIFISSKIYVPRPCDAAWRGTG